MRSPLGLGGASSERRRRVMRRLLPALGALAVVALVLGFLVASGMSAEERTARSYALAWQRGNYEEMYRLLTPGAQRAIELDTFVAAHRTAAATATATEFDAEEAEGDGDGARVPFRIRTNAFGTLDEELFVPVHKERVVWRAEMV